MLLNCCLCWVTGWHQTLSALFHIPDLLEWFSGAVWWERVCNAIPPTLRTWTRFCPCTAGTSLGFKVLISVASLDQFESFSIFTPPPCLFQRPGLWFGFWGAMSRSRQLYDWWFSYQTHTCVYFLSVCIYRSVSKHSFIGLSFIVQFICGVGDPCMVALSPHHAYGPPSHGRLSGTLSHSTPRLKIRHNLGEVSRTCVWAQMLTFLKRKKLTLVHVPGSL